MNPAAGSHDATDEIIKAIKNCGQDIDYEIYRTKCPGDATEYASKLCAETTNDYRFYACGGDGTLGEVVNAVVGAKNASVTVYPCGSGNDFIKYYGSVEDFRDIRSLVNGVEHTIDVMKIGSRYAVNIVNFGFDTAVVKTMLKVKRSGILSGKRAYYAGVCTALLKSMKTKCKVTVDGKRLGADDLLLCTIGNGRYVGGSFKCSPRSFNDDGLLEICLINPVSRFTFIRLIGAYTAGSHIEDNRFKNVINYCRGKSIELEAENGFCLCLDGDLIDGRYFKVEVVEKALNFVVPASLSAAYEKSKGSAELVH